MFACLSDGSFADTHKSAALNNSRNLCHLTDNKMNSTSVTCTASELHKAVLTSSITVALIFNIVCIALTGRIANHKPQWPNILVVQIGVIDLCVVLLALLPGTIALYLPEILHQIHFCHFQGTVLNVWYILEYLLLAQIMFDRYFAVAYPFMYNKQILNSKALIWPNVVLLGITVVAILIACLPYAASVKFIVIGPGICFWDASQDGALPVSVINVAVALTALAILILFTGGICIGVYQMLRKSHNSDTSGTKRKGNKMEVNFAKLTIVTSLVFGASSIPFIVSAIIIQYGTNTTVVVIIMQVTIILQITGQYIDQDVQYIGICILMASVLLNPLLHSTVRRPVRRALLLLVKWLFYIVTGCRSKFKPTVQIGMLHFAD